MTTFFNVLYTSIGIEHKVYPDEPFPNNFNYILPLLSDEDSILKFMSNNLHYLYKNKNPNINQIKAFTSAKFEALNHILENTFCKDEFKEKILNKFCIIQKTYKAFAKLANIYRYKFYKTVVDNDLSLNKLDPKSNNVIIIIDKSSKSKYLFLLSEIVKIIETAISNSPNFFTESLWPINPYCRQKFCKHDLYNIYYILKRSLMNMSTLFHCFFLVNFELKMFQINNECLIRDFAIKKYTYNSPYTTLYNSIFNMLEANRFSRLLEIDPDFPKDKLVEIFRPFLYYYFIVNYDIRGTNKIYEYKSILNQKLRKFYEYNKIFGRKVYKLEKTVDPLTKKVKITRTHFFNDKHLPFHQIKLNDNLPNIVVSQSLMEILHFAFGHNRDSDEEDYYDDSDVDSVS
jgi:hypothetical protein